ncbi:MAG: multidrug ABC transporter substrate-binding protein [Bacteroidetes bacterium GWF2_33_38]|nr:MAG: multidrug ABC transporter substrate-binding protein [Bacteroidetes bacterium GWF2_33_38]OFY92343.1 MAG: multidrug ABC transporter substrate-binding protein [Bacteroidetes bacterium RIFOXYA2_FULL_33_7]
MNFYNLLISSLRSLGKNKFRTFLTMLGIIIGVASVIVMQSIGKGVETSIKSDISSIGTNLIMVTPEAAEKNGVQQSAGSEQTLKIKDVEMIKNYCASVKYISPMIMSSSQIKYSSNNCRSSVMGVAAEYLQIRNIDVTIGAPFTNEDIEKSAKVCLIGKTVKNNLFKNDEDPIGKSIRIGTIPFTIIGILKEKGQSGFGQDQDDIVIAPYTSVQNRISGNDYLQQIFISAQSENEVDKAVQEISYCMRLSHKLKVGDVDDFSISTQSEIMQTMESVTGTLTAFLASIAAISLLVGGIGIMNIMFVSVTERTKEIGIRLAIGATSFDVLMQFLIEAIVLTLLAGILGLAFGFGLSQLISFLMNIEAVITVSSVVLSFSVCSFIGIFFGWYPARKAAKLNPIDALRYE